MTKKGRKLTAAEFAAELERDPEYQAKLAAQRERAVSTQAAEQLVLGDLVAAGYPVSSLAQLRREYRPLPPEAVAVLLEWVPKMSDVAIQEAMVRDLANVQEPFQVQPLLSLFERTESESLRWAIGNTIAELRPLDARDWVIAMLANRGHGRGREMLPLALARIASQSKANEVLRIYLDEMPGHVALGFAESGGPAELELVRQRAKGQKGWVRKELDRAARKIAKRVSEGG